MGAPTLPRIRRNTNADTAETLTRDADTLMAASGVERSRGWISRTVRAYMGAPVEGMPFGVFLDARLDLNTTQRRRLAERADLRYLLTYADPTGETAARNVDRVGGDTR